MVDSDTDAINTSSPGGGEMQARHRVWQINELRQLTLSFLPRKDQAAALTLDRSTFPLAAAVLYRSWNYNEAVLRGVMSTDRLRVYGQAVCELITLDDGALATPMSYATVLGLMPNLSCITCEDWPPFRCDFLTKTAVPRRELGAQYISSMTDILGSGWRFKTAPENRESVYLSGSGWGHDVWDELAERYSTKASGVESPRERLSLLSIDLNGVPDDPPTPTFAADRVEIAADTIASVRMCSAAILPPNGELEVRLVRASPRAATILFDTPSMNVARQVPEVEVSAIMSIAEEDSTDGFDSANAFRNAPRWTDAPSDQRLKIFRLELSTAAKDGSCFPAVSDLANALLNIGGALCEYIVELRYMGVFSERLKAIVDMVKKEIRRAIWAVREHRAPGWRKLEVSERVVVAGGSSAQD